MLIKKFTALYLCLLIVSCKDYQKNKSHQQTSNASIKAGEKLSKQYCGSCHQYPEPSLLDTKSWDSGVLPGMGPRLGIFFYGFNRYPSDINDTSIGKDFSPSQPVLSLAQWQNIIDYYTATSPDSLTPAKKPVAIAVNDKLFQPFKPSFAYPMPAISFIKFQPAGKLMLSDVIKRKLFIFNNALQLTDSININGAVTDVIEDSDKLILCNTGSLNPNNRKFGSLQRISPKDTSLKKILFSNLMRPVQISSADINNDGKKDFVVCEFGNLKGALSWLENKGNDNYIYHLIRAAPGAIKTYITDYNHDGLPDIYALFAQGDEGIFLFTNKGNGVFDAKEVLQFPPSYGSSSFELDDFNKDGFPDIVYTCGDNADYSRVLKPYHGVYIFMNDGKNNFTQKFFYPINGCYKAIARDFDNDGDLDIATIAFFADYKNQPEEGFIYLKNNGNFNFRPYSLNATKYGRWLIMDAGDFDGDGRIDLALGNFSLGAPMSKSTIDWKKQPSFLILRNVQ